MAPTEGKSGSMGCLVFFGAAIVLAGVSDDYKHKIGYLQNTISEQSRIIYQQKTPHIENVMGGQRPEKFYKIKGPNGEEINAFVEIDGKPVTEYFTKPYVGPVEKQ